MLESSTLTVEGDQMEPEVAEFSCAWEEESFQRRIFFWLVSGFHHFFQQLIPSSSFLQDFRRPHEVVFLNSKIKCLWFQKRSFDLEYLRRPSSVFPAVRVSHLDTDNLAFEVTNLQDKSLFLSLVCRLPFVGEPVVGKGGVAEVCFIKQDVLCCESFIFTCSPQYFCLEPTL